MTSGLSGSNSFLVVGVMVIVLGFLDLFCVIIMKVADPVRIWDCNCSLVELMREAFCEFLCLPGRHIHITNGSKSPCKWLRKQQMELGIVFA